VQTINDPVFRFRTGTELPRGRALIGPERKPAEPGHKRVAAAWQADASAPNGTKEQKPEMALKIAAEARAQRSARPVQTWQTEPRDVAQEAPLRQWESRPGDLDTGRHRLGFCQERWGPKKSKVWPSSALPLLVPRPVPDPPAPVFQPTSLWADRF
jgi:hypothetical protein